MREACLDFSVGRRGMSLSGLHANVCDSDNDTDSVEAVERASSSRTWSNLTASLDRPNSVLADCERDSKKDRWLTNAGRQFLMIFERKCFQC